MNGSEEAGGPRKAATTTKKDEQTTDAAGPGKHGPLQPPHHFLLRGKQ